MKSPIRLELDHKEATSCDEIALLPPIKSRKKKKQKHQITVDLHERVEKENDISEGTPLVVDSKSVLADPRSDLDDEKAQLCGEADALPSGKKIKSKKRKPKKQMTVAVNPAEEAPTPVDQDLHVNREKMMQKQNITEVVNPDARNISAVDPTSDLQDNVSRKKKKKNRKGEQNSANLVNPETNNSNMSTVAPTSVLQGLNGNSGQSDESKGLMLSKDDCLMHSSNLVSPDASSMPGVVPTSDLQENVNGKKRKRNRKQGQNSADLVNPEIGGMSTAGPTSVLLGLNGNIGPSDESKSVILSKDDCLAPTSDLQENVSGKKSKRKKRGQNSANLVDPETSNMSTVATESVLQGLNGNIDPSDESKSVMLSKDDCLAPTSDLQENVSGKKSKRKKRGQNSANLVDPETSNMSTVATESVLQGLNGNIDPSDESKSLMLSKDDDCLLHSSNLVIPEASNMPTVAPASDLQENVSAKKSKRKKRGQISANPETSNMSTVATASVLQGLNGNIDPSDESKSLMLSKDDCLAPTSDLQENVSGKKSKRKKRGQNSANSVDPETSNMSTVATESVLQGLNGNIDPSDESKSLMLSKDDCLLHSSNLVIPEASNMPTVAPASDLQENLSAKKSKRKKRGQISANPETSNMSTVATASVLQGLNGNIDPSDESKSLMLAKDDCLLHSSNLVIPEASNMLGVAPTSDLQEKVSGKKSKRKKRGQNSANLVNPETNNMSTVATTSVLQGLNGNIDPSDESKSLVPSKDDCLMRSSNLVIPEASNMPALAPTSDLQESLSGKKRKKKRKHGQHAAILVNPETCSMASVAPASVLEENLSGKERKTDMKGGQHSANLVKSEVSHLSNLPPTPVLQELNGNTGPSDESQCLMQSKDKLLIPDDLVNPEASSSMSTITPTSVSQENLSGGKRKRKRNQGQHSTNLVNPETNVLQGLNGNIAAYPESKFSMPSKDELLMNDTVAKKDMPQHIPNSTSQISSDKVLEKKLLILDLNGLLADIVPYTNETRKHDLVLSKKYVYKRPYVDEFIEFCLERFTVAVWSSRIKRNIDPLVNFLFGTDRRRKLLFCWNQAHCTKTTFFTIDGTLKPLVLKDIQKVWDYSFKDPKWVLYNESNTLLLDDSPYKALINPANTAIFPHSYSYTQVDDNALGPGGELQVYLEGVSLADNVQEYVRNNPFGQSQITESHPSWDFYRAVKDLYGRCVDPLKELRNLPRTCRTSYIDASGRRRNPKRSTRASGSFKEVRNADVSEESDSGADVSEESDSGADVSEESDSGADVSEESDSD